MIIWILMAFNGALGSNPDITVIGNYTKEKPGYNIECDPTVKPLVIEFLTDDRTECAIRKKKGSCSYFNFEHVEQGKVILVSDRNPLKDQIFGCAMIFNDTDDFLKVYCSVQFNGTDFVQITREITRTTEFSYTGDVDINETAQDKDIKGLIIVPVVVLFVVEHLFVVLLLLCRRRINDEQSPSYRTRQRDEMSFENS